MGWSKGWRGVSEGCYGVCKCAKPYSHACLYVRMGYHGNSHQLERCVFQTLTNTKEITCTVPMLMI